MLLIHWAKQNRTGTILKTGIRVGSRKDTWHGRHLEKPTPRGVYVFPYTHSRHARGTWRRILKRGVQDRGNYNGFVFRLRAADFPLLAGPWYELHADPRRHRIDSLRQLTETYPHLAGAHVDTARAASTLEILLPRRVAPHRIIRVLRDREPRASLRGRNPFGVDNDGAHGPRVASQPWAELRNAFGVALAVTNVRRWAHCAAAGSVLNYVRHDLLL